ncbi:shieldin complex subunit 3 [Cyprinodon tularosa]|uniref:shieldin complex subunit 3 n=1 Tax=Cyprinodon tularosa TaxID=77115 RepID=UPI0018E26ECA|nr:shieldin complex subunit 3 [Cyprinodon tularosa]
MDDVVLHYQPGSAVRLSCLLEQTEKLLEPFTCRPPPVFSPWFPTVAAEHRLPIRPAKPAPQITSAGVTLTTTTATENKLQTGNPIISAETQPEQTEEPLCITETPNHLLPVRSTPAVSPREHPGTEGDGSPVRRSWSVFTQKGVLLQKSLSKHFHRLVSVHRLHLRQRAKWVITQQNCRDVEKVWRSLSRSVRSSGFPPCNANIRREQAEIWVFCDVLYSEQVGRLLKDELQLSGRIHLSVHKLGTIFSM